MNKQPFYHRAVVLFTGTRDIDRDEFQKMISKIASRDIVKGSLEVEEIDSEPGDPADLM